MCPLGSTSDLSFVLDSFNLDAERHFHIHPERLVAVEAEIVTLEPAERIGTATQPWLQHEIRDAFEAIDGECGAVRVLAFPEYSS